MLADGKKIQIEIKESIKRDVSDSRTKYCLALLYAGENLVTNKFIEIKKKFGEDVGIQVDVFKYDECVSEEVVLKKIKDLGEDDNYGGIIVQLPLPTHLNTDTVLDSVPKHKDVDVLSKEAITSYISRELLFEPAVVGAVRSIFEKYNISLVGKQIAVVGKGRLVGSPICNFLKRNMIRYVLIDSSTKNSNVILKNADIIITGIGKPHFIKPDMIKSGVVLMDAGTSELSGKLLGDVDPDCEKKASLLTPVPGGVGPITIAIIFKNLIDSK